MLFVDAALCSCCITKEEIKHMCFQPDYTNILMVLNNQRPDYLPLYEHHIDAVKAIRKDEKPYY